MLKCSIVARLFQRGATDKTTTENRLLRGATIRRHEKNTKAAVRYGNARKVSEWLTDKIPLGQNPLTTIGHRYRRPDKLMIMYLFLVLKVVVLDYNCDGL